MSVSNGMSPAYPWNPWRDILGRENQSPKRQVSQTTSKEKRVCHFILTHSPVFMVFAMKSDYVTLSILFHNDPFHDVSVDTSQIIAIIYHFFIILFYLQSLAFLVVNKAPVHIV